MNLILPIIRDVICKQSNNPKEKDKHIVSALDVTKLPMKELSRNSVIEIPKCEIGHYKKLNYIETTIALP